MKSLILFCTHLIKRSEIKKHCWCKTVEEKAVGKWLTDKQCAKFHNCRKFGSLENGVKLRYVCSVRSYSLPLTQLCALIKEAAQRGESNSLDRSNGLAVLHFVTFRVPKRLN
jgi:hypothetical protein